LGTGSGM